MELFLTEERKIMQKQMRDFVEKECLPIEEEMMHKDPDWVELPPEHFNHIRYKVKEMGFWALDVPVEYGGQGLDTITYCLIAEEECRTVIGTTHFSPLWSPLAENIFPALYRGTDYQKHKYLYPMIRGEKRAALAQTEPEAGSDASAIKTTAVRKDNGWIINGRKRFSTMADRADFLYVTAVTDKSKGRDGISVFLVDTDSPGFRIERIINVLRPQYSTEPVFDDCFVPDENRLEGSGWVILQEGLDKLRMLFAQMCVGRASRSLDIVLNYIPHRITFSKPLSERQAVQWMLADSAIDIHLARLMALDGAWKVDQGMDTRGEAAMIKVFASEMAYRVLDRCIQCLGGIGLTKDLPLERWFREVRVMRITEGPSEIQRMLIARNLSRGWRP